MSNEILDEEYTRAGYRRTTRGQRLAKAADTVLCCWMLVAAIVLPMVLLILIQDGPR